MLTLLYSNRYEVLTEALLTSIDARERAWGGAGDAFAATEIVIPSIGIARRIETDIAARFSVCANVRFSYLAQWLWHQLEALAPPGTGGAQQPGAQSLIWRIFAELEQTRQGGALAGLSARLDAYLEASDEVMRFELARRVATIFDHYATYRPDWLQLWHDRASIFADADASVSQPGLRRASAAQREDERWQAALSRRVFAALDGDDAREAALLPAQILPLLRSLDLATAGAAAWPEAVHVFALPTIAPLHVAMLRELSQWLDVHIYGLNPCREFWFDIVAEARVDALALAEKIDFQEVGNPLLAAWGRQSQAHLHTLHELTETRAAQDDAIYEPNPGSHWVAALQNAMLDLREWPQVPSASGPLGASEAARQGGAGIEVHVCHSLSRQLEVLHDRLLAMFDADATLEPADVLVALPDLPAAAPLIDAVFGTAAEARRIPYRITGLPPSHVNPIARVLLELLALPEREPVLGDLIDCLRVEALASRYQIDATMLDAARDWLIGAGARRGLDRAQDAERVSRDTDGPQPGRPGREGNEGRGPGELLGGQADEAWATRRLAGRHTFADALSRLFLGYAMPDGAFPVGDCLPLGLAVGAEGELLGRLARLIDDLDHISQEFSRPATPAQWRERLYRALETVFDAAPPHAEALAEVRDTCADLLARLESAAPALEIGAALIARALREAMDDSARGGVPAGGVSFAAFASLRQLPYRIICLIGMDEGALPSVARADEFDLIAAFGRQGDRQRRADERNLFLDMIVAARDALLIGYTGRSIRDNAALPPAALVDELLDYLARAAAGPAADPESLKRARQGFIIEHPLQSFADSYFDGDPRYLSFDASRAAIAGALSARGRPAPAHDSLGAPSGGRFFPAPLPAPLLPAAIDVDVLARFFSHPSRALLRERLGVRLQRALSEADEYEPFGFDFQSRDAVSARVLPSLIEAASGDGEEDFERAVRIARASPEAPDGATGAVIQQRELSQMRALAERVRQARAAPCADQAYFFEIDSRWPPALDPAIAGGAPPAGMSFSFEGTLRGLTTEGQVLYSDARVHARALLRSWLFHLRLCAVRLGEADVDADVETRAARWTARTHWIGNDGGFVFEPVAEARDILAGLLALYQAGLCWPLNFFPKSAWARLAESPPAAQRVFEGSPRSVGEREDDYIRLAFGGDPAPLDARFEALADWIFEPLRAHLREMPEVGAKRRSLQAESKEEGKGEGDAAA